MTVKELIHALQKMPEHRQVSVIDWEGGLIDVYRVEKFDNFGYHLVTLDCNKYKETTQ